MKFYTRMQIDRLKAISSLNLQILKIQDGEQPPFWKPLNRHISAEVPPVAMKFGMVTRPHSTLLCHFLFYLIKPQKLHKTTLASVQFLFVVKAIALKQQLSKFYKCDRLLLCIEFADNILVFAVFKDVTLTSIAKRNWRQIQWDEIWRVHSVTVAAETRLVMAAL